MPDLPYSSLTRPVPAPADLTRLRVLIAEPSPFLRSMFAHLLEGQGMTVVGRAADGAEALRLVGQMRPHLLLLGVGSSGLDAALLRQAKAACPGMEVTAMAGGRDYAVLGQLLEAGAGAVLATPVDTGMLCAELERAGRRCVATLATRTILGFTAPESERQVRALPSQSDYPQAAVLAQPAMPRPTPALPA